MNYPTTKDVGVLRFQNKKKEKATVNLRQLVRPMFTSTITFGYATPEQVENTLDEIAFSFGSVASGETASG